MSGAGRLRLSREELKRKAEELLPLLEDAVEYAYVDGDVDNTLRAAQFFNPANLEQAQQNWFVAEDGDSFLRSFIEEGIRLSARRAMPPQKDLVGQLQYPSRGAKLMYMNSWAIPYRFPKLVEFL